MVAQAAGVLQHDVRGEVGRLQVRGPGLLDHTGHAQGRSQCGDSLGGTPPSLSPEINK